MTDRFRIAICAFLSAAGAVAPVYARELPSSQKDATVCLYRNLRAQPHITGVDVYFDDWKNVVIAYSFRDAHGNATNTALFISGPYADGRFEFSGDFMYRDNPLPGLLPTLDQKCRAYGGYVDQVFITPDDPREWLVDMSKYEQ